MDTRADVLYIHTRHDVISYFRSEVMAKKTVKNTASDGFEC